MAIDTPAREESLRPARRRWLARLRGVPRFPAVIVLLVALAAILSDLINGTVLHDPYGINLLLRHSPPWPLEGWDSSRLLGSDILGRDVLSRLVLGARFSLMVAAGTVVIATIAGAALGLISGYSGGWVDGVVMRLVDMMIAFPSILIALLFVVVLGASLWMVIGILAFVVSSRIARVVRGEVLSWKERDFVALARVAGASPRHILVRHILPNVTSTILVLATLHIGYVIVVEATLSFLGAGVPPPDPTWGNMIADGRNYLDEAWWVSVTPGVALALTVLSFNLLGDWIRDALDPRLRQL